MAEVPAYATSTASAPIRLDRNESPEEMPERLREEVLARLSSSKWSRYPDPYAAELKKALGEREGLSADRVIVGNGSNSLFLSFFLASGAPGRRIGICPPTFGLFASWAKAAGAVVETFPLGEEDLDPPVEAMLERARRDPGLMFVLCSPNNPTGTLFPREGLIELLEAGNYVLMDEAYVEFVEGYDGAGGASPSPTTRGASARGLLERFPNLLISRTLSKAAALAGVRVGYMLGDAALVAGDREGRSAVLSVEPLREGGRDGGALRREETRQRVGAIVAERRRMMAALADRPGGRLSDSHANFLYIRPERPAEQLFDALLSRGILVRSSRGRGVSPCVSPSGSPGRMTDSWRPGEK